MPRWFLASAFLHVVSITLFVALPDLARLYPQAFPEWLRKLLAPAPALVAIDVEMPDPPARAQAEPEVTISSRVVVDPRAVSELPPDVATHQGAEHSLAANLESTRLEAPVPRVEAPKRETPGTFENYRPEPGGARTKAPDPEPETAPEPPAPALPPPRPAPVAVKPLEALPPPVVPVLEPVKIEKARVLPQPEARPAPPVGDLAMAVPQPRPAPPATPPAPVPVAATPPPAAPLPKPAPPTPQKPPDPAPARRRPKRLSEVTGAGAEQTFKARQDGGVSRTAVTASYNVRASAMGVYMSRLSTDVSHRWFALLDEARFTYSRTGKVMVRFKLHPDGSVTDVMTESTEVGDLLSFYCESAIIEPAPYPKWPADLIAQHGKQAIEVTFTFSYL